MAPLTWRNVQAPNFADSNYLHGLSARLFDQGIRSAMEGLDRFRNITQDEQSAALMRDVIAAGNDPTAIRQTVAGRDATFLTPDALRFANAQPGILLDREQARATIDGTRANTALTGVRTDQGRYDLGRSQTLDGREDARFAAQEQARPILYQAERLARAGNPGAAQALLDRYQQLLSAAGHEPSALYGNVSSGFRGGMEDTQDAIRHDEFVYQARNLRDSRQLLDLVGQNFNDPESAIRGVRDLQAQGHISSDLASEAISLIPQSGLWTPLSEDEQRLQRGLGINVSRGRGRGDSSWYTGARGTRAGEGTPDVNRVLNEFMGTVEQGGLTNPYALAAVEAYGHRESGFRPENVTGTWEDSSETGQPGRSGGVMSLRNDRYDNMLEYTGGDLSPSAQGNYFLNENPVLIGRLNQVRSVEEANEILADAWRFAGYNNREGGEYQARLNLANKIYDQRTNQTISGNTQPPGMVQPGNINLNNRPRVETPDGRIATVRSMSVNINGREVLIPTVSDNGELLSEDEAIELYRQTGRHLGIFDNPEAASAYAEQLHEDQERQYVGTSPQRVQDIGPQEVVRPSPAVDQAVVAQEPRHEWLQPGGLNRDAAELFSRFGEAAVNQGAGLVDLVNIPFRGAARYLTGEDVFSPLGRVDFNDDGYGQSYWVPGRSPTEDLRPEDRPRMTSAQLAEQIMNEVGGIDPGTPDVQLGGRRDRVTLSQAIEGLRTARNTLNMDRTFNTYASIDAALAQGRDGPSTAAVAKEMTSDEGSFPDIEASDMRDVINRVMDEGKVPSAAVARVLIEDSARINPPGWFSRNFGSGEARADINDIIETWANYQSDRNDGGSRIQGGVSRLNIRERINEAGNSIDSLNTILESAIRARDEAVSKASTTAEKQRIIDEYEREVFPLIDQRVQAIVGSDLLESYSRGTTNR